LDERHARSKIEATVVALLEVKGLKTYFYLRRGIVKAVDDVSFTVDRGETLGIVGESGCGKTITSLSLLRLVPDPGKIIAGQILFDGVDLLCKTEEEMNKYRGRHISEILQDPLNSLNPVFTIGDQVAEGIVIHDSHRGNELRESVVGLLERLRIPNAETRIDQYPHQLSGGMRQRVVGAISIACRPELLIADEPTTSLDVTIQLQYLNLLKAIQERDRIALIFITHDFGIVAKMCDRVAVMYAGRIVEAGNVRDIFDRPLHPYTTALVNSVPKADERVDRLYSIEGQPPSLLNIPSRCAFYERCSDRFDPCAVDAMPPEVEFSNSQKVRCWKHVRAIV
jgi:oligopeptide/dipeptide ABC transporter ATP-binding protein